MFWLIARTNPRGPQYYRITPSNIDRGNCIVFDEMPGILVSYSEHDTDTAIRQIFTHNALPVKECMCNPPEVTGQESVILHRLWSIAGHRFPVCPQSEKAS